MSDEKEKLREELKKMEAPKMKIDYQVDTLANANESAYFSHGSREVVIHYIEGTGEQVKSTNEWNNTDETRAHEHKHRYNHDNGMYNMPMNLEQYYKVCCHDEISANMAGLLQLREEYKMAKTEKEREKIASSTKASLFSYYFDAVKEGKIDPFATSKQDFEKEMKFIATETQKMWLNRYATTQYDSPHVSMTRRWMATHDYDELKSNPQNYEKAREIAYTIGGIDFRKYMDDIPLTNENIKKADQLVSADKNRKEVYNVMVTAGHPTALTSMEQHAKLSALEGVSDELKITMEVRQQWLNCKTDEEKKELEKKVNETGVSSFASRWLYAANNGQIAPTKGLLISEEEKKFLGNLVSQNTKAVCRGGMNFIEEYVDQKGWMNIADAIKSGEADKNYATAKKELFTAGGIDFSSYVNEPVMADPNIALADKTFREGESFALKDILKPFDETKDLIVPEFTPIEGLSMEQQLKVAQHQMYMENVKARSPNLQVEVEKESSQFGSKIDWSDPDELTGFFKERAQEEAVKNAVVESVDDSSSYLAPLKEESLNFLTQPWNKLSNNAEWAQYSFEQFQKDLENNPELKKKWKEASKQYEKQIAEANKGTIILPSKDEKKYQRELDKIYTVNGVNVKNEYQGISGNVGKIEKSMPKIETVEIKKVENSSVIDRAKVKAKTAYHETTAWIDKTTEETKQWVEQKSEASKEWVKDKWNAFKSWCSGDDKKSKPQSKQTSKIERAKSSQVASRGTQAKSTEHRKKEYEDTYYTGEPKYDTWSPEHRVSPVQYAEIYDFTAPYLKQQQEALAKKEAEEKAKKAAEAKARKEAEEKARKSALETKREYSEQKFDQKVDKTKQDKEAEKTAQNKSQTKCGSKKQQNSR